MLAAILAAAFYVPYELNERSNERYVQDAIPLRALVQDLVLQMVNQQNSVRAYLVTRDPDSLAPYRAGHTAVNRDLAAMRPHLSRHPSMARLVQRAVAQIADLEGYFARQVLLAQMGPRGQRLAQAGIDEGERAFARFRRSADLMLAETNRFVREAERAQQRTYRRLLFILGALGVLAAAIAGWIFVRTPRRLGEVYAAEERFRREAESRADAARALEHVGDGVVLTDADDRVRFWNPAAERIMEVSRSEALNRRFGDLAPGLAAAAGRTGATTFPLQTSSGERWLSITSVDFGEGTVHAVRDLTAQRQLDAMQQNFLATASHELRTPMTSVYGAARTLLHHEDRLTSEQRRTFMEMIVTEADRLSRIVDDILLASRLDAGAVEVLTERCDGYSLARSVVDAARLGAPSTIDLKLQARPDLPPVAGDPDRVRQVLVNLIDNAIKYSPEGGEVLVSLAATDSTVRFVVSDEGLGFPPEEESRIFERFQRLDPNQTRGIGGTGLGLYISRELVQRMRGRIWARSRPGRGSSFFFELPVIG